MISKTLWMSSVAWVLATGTAAYAQPADTLRVGNWDFPSGRGNPFSSVPGHPQIYVWSAIFDTMTYVDGKGLPTAGLAQSWRNIDRTTWEFKLRPNVKFSNGELLDAQAVADTIAWFKSDAGKTTVGATTFGYVNEAKVIDPQTVQFTTSAPRPIFPVQVSAMYIVPPKAWKEMGVERFSTAPIGTGSFEATEWTEQSIKLKAVPGSWRAPKIGRIEYLRLQEPAARLQALASNQIDIMIQVTPDQVAAVKGAGASVDVVPSPLLLQLAFVLEGAKAGVDNKMLQDKRVRHALNHAVDKESINKNLMGGLFGINTQYSMPIAFGYNPNLKPFEYDPEKAKKLLAEAGYPNGFSLLAEVRDYPEVMQVVAQDLAKVGVKVELRPMVMADWLRKFLQNQWDGQTFGVTLGVAPELDTIRMMVFQSCRKNPAYYCNKDLMPLIDAIDSEFDSDKRRAMLHDLMAKMRDDAPAIFLFEQQDLNGIGKRVKGFKNTTRIFNYHELTLAN